MDELEPAIRDAWQRVKPQLLADRDELARRLARRRTPTLARPPRAWCLAVRASDRRINPASAMIVPEHAVDQRDREHPGRFLRHDVLLDAKLLDRLCIPVRIDPPGEPWDDVAKKLGVNYCGLRTARISGVVHTHHIPRLGGRRGRPVPLLYTDQLLDPGSRGFVNSDPLWGWTARYLTHRLDRDFHQTIRRVPLYRALVARHRYDPHAHPELDGGAPRSTHARRLPPPRSDYVSYKWSDGVYVGDAREQRTRQRRERARQKQRQYLRLHPRPSTSGGSLSFRGWQWLCPDCNRTCNTLYLPLPPINLLITDPSARPPSLRASGSCEAGGRPWSLRASPSHFACARCHRVQFFTRASSDAWNLLIATLSGGLLYGREVPRPADFLPARRRRPYRPMINRSAPQRQRVLRMLLAGLDHAEIARRQGIRHDSVNNHTHKIYRQHGVHSREQLMRMLQRQDPTESTATRGICI